MTTLELAVLLGYCQQQQIQDLLDETDQIAAMLVGLGKTIESRTDSKSLRELEEDYSLLTAILSANSNLCDL